MNFRKFSFEPQFFKYIKTYTKSIQSKTNFKKTVFQKASDGRGHTRIKDLKQASNDAHWNGPENTKLMIYLRSNNKLTSEIKGMLCEIANEFWQIIPRYNKSMDPR